jgi:predicted small integral membrane protein
MTVRLAKMIVVAVIAAFFTVETYSNLTDFGTNFEPVRHVLSMDTTFQSPNLMWRAVTDPVLQTQAYWLIIGWQGLVAFFCWLGAVRLLTAWGASPRDFDRAKALAIFGLLLGFLLYGLGFLVIASEWFAMWQSKQWNAQATAGMFTTVIVAVMIFVAIPEPRDGKDEA